MSLGITSGVIALLCLIMLAISWWQELQDQKTKQEREARRQPNTMRKRFAKLKQQRQS